MAISQARGGHSAWSAFMARPRGLTRITLPAKGRTSKMRASDRFIGMPLVCWSSTTIWQECHPRAA